MCRLFVRGADFELRTGPVRVEWEERLWVGFFALEGGEGG